MNFLCCNCSAPSEADETGMTFYACEDCSAEIMRRLSKENQKLSAWDHNHTISNKPNGINVGFKVTSAVYDIASAMIQERWRPPVKSMLIFCYGDGCGCHYLDSCPVHGTGHVSARKL